MNNHVISRVRLRADAGAYALRPLAAGAHGIHQMLWKLYSDQTRFLFRETRERVGEYYIISNKSPTADDQNLFYLESKPYNPRLPQGESLEFVLRACATVCRDGKRHDIVQDRRSHGDQRPRLEIANEVGPQWLARQGARSGFELLHCYVDGYEQHQTRRQSGGQPIRFATLDLSGVLRVTETEQFTETLYRGLGRAKAFGAGLLLVRRLA